MAYESDFPEEAGWLLGLVTAENGLVFGAGYSRLGGQCSVYIWGLALPV